MSGVLIYSEKEATRNTFAIIKFKEELGVALAINDYDGTADFIINRTNNYKIAEKFEKKGIRVFNPSSLSKLANNKQLCYEFMEKNGIEIVEMPYPSSTGFVIRSFELTGACVAAGTDNAKRK